MSTNFYKILSKNNTAPFIVIALVYCLFLSSPFLYFSYLKGQVHVSHSVGIDENNSPTLESKPQDVTDSLKKKDSFYTTDISQVPANENDGEENRTSDVVVSNTKYWKEDADSRGFIILTKIAIFSIILAFGALGAAISLVTRIRNSESISNSITTFEILSVQTIGAVFALILGFAFMGNMIAGTLFPNPLVFTRIIYVAPAFGKLIVWSFIAGFSERFVPNLLNNFSKKADEGQ